MRKPTFCICENKGADQICSNCEADQHLCFRYTDSTILLLSKSEISSLYLSSVAVQADLCRTCVETILLFFFFMTQLTSCSRTQIESNPDPHDPES